MKSKKTALIAGLRVSEELAIRARKALEKLGTEGTELRRGLWLDFIRIAESGEIPATPPRIMTAKQAEILEAYVGAQEAAAKIGLDINEFRRAMVRDFIRIVESGEVPAIPPRVMTQREAIILHSIQHGAKYRY